MNPSAFKKIPLNEDGRDFVLGDIHGAFDMVLRGMKQVKFDPSVDRILAVGDLIDRGQGSIRALGFLSQPYVHAVRGNHDHDFSTLTLAEIRVLAEANWFGMSWAVDVPDAKLLALKAAFDDLPVAMQVETRLGPVGIVHGDIPQGMSWTDFVAALLRGDPKVTELALTGRKRIKSGDETGVPGIGRVYVGHTVQWKGPKRLGNVYAIDCGAVFRELDQDRGSLAMVNVAAHTMAIGPVVDLAQRRHVMALSEAGEGPFGAYAQGPIPWV
jgi:serine/threonine protein phosphatase 1